MTLDISKTLEAGFETATDDQGLVFIGLFFLLSTISSFTALGVMGSRDSMLHMPYFFQAVFSQISLLSWNIFLLALGIASIVVTIAALRNFTTGDKITREEFEHSIGLATLNILIGSIFFGILVAAGTVFFIIPGLFIFVSLVTWTIYVSVEDQNFVEAMRNSWRLTSGNRLRLFALGVLVLLATALVDILLGIPQVFMDSNSAFFIDHAASAFNTVFSLATLSEAYKQLQ